MYDSCRRRNYPKFFPQRSRWGMNCARRQSWRAQKKSGPAWQIQLGEPIFESTESNWNQTGAESEGARATPADESSFRRERECGERFDHSEQSDSMETMRASFKLMPHSLELLGTEGQQLRMNVFFLDRQREASAQ